MYDELVKKLRSHNGWALNKTLDEAADYLFYFMAACSLFNFFIKPFLPWYQ